MDKLILAIDQGTSGTKALLYNTNGGLVKKATADLHTNYFDNGFVEQDPNDILESVRNACVKCLEGIDSNLVTSIGISNQRETFLLWDKEGRAVTPAIVWACKRSTEICKKILDQNEWINKKTGLTIDPYFSATKLIWLIQEDPILKNRIQNREIYFGTIDTWLLFHFTKQQSFFTDYTNASRTLFFNIWDLKWDQEILERWGLEGLQLPAIKSSGANFGTTDLFGLIPKEISVHAMMGDSHAAMFGECCFKTGETKMTLGTGCSMLMHIGNKPLLSNNGLLTTIGWSTRNELVYAWEGAIVACGSMISWLQESLHLINDPKETEAMALSVTDNAGVYLIPAFSGLGAPIWDMQRRASLIGINFGTQAAHIVRATLESICFQIQDVLLAMEKDLQHPIEAVSMHGGLSQNKFIQNQLASLINAKIYLQNSHDISAQGIAYLAGIEAGIYESLDWLKKTVSKNSIPKNSEANSMAVDFQQWKNIIQQNKF